MAVNNIIDQLKRDEEFSATPYRDSEGFLTIGYGTNIERGIDQVEAEFLLNHRYEVRAKLPVASALPWTASLDPARLGVLENMCYNLGIGDSTKGTGLLGFHTLLYCFERRDWQGAAEAMRSSLWRRQVGARAERLIQQVLTGEWQ